MPGGTGRYGQKDTRTKEEMLQDVRYSIVKSLGSYYDSQRGSNEYDSMIANYEIYNRMSDEDKADFLYENPDFERDYILYIKPIEDYVDAMDEAGFIRAVGHSYYIDDKVRIPNEGYVTLEEFTEDYLKNVEDFNQYASSDEKAAEICANAASNAARQDLGHSEAYDYDSHVNHDELRTKDEMLQQLRYEAFSASIATDIYDDDKHAELCEMYDTYNKLSDEDKLEYLIDNPEFEEVYTKYGYPWEQAIEQLDEGGFIQEVGHEWTIVDEYTDDKGEKHSSFDICIAATMTADYKSAPISPGEYNAGSMRMILTRAAEGYGNNNEVKHYGTATYEGQNTDIEIKSKEEMMSDVAREVAATYMFTGDIGNELPDFTKDEIDGYLAQYDEYRVLSEEEKLDYLDENPEFAEIWDQYMQPAEEYVAMLDEAGYIQCTGYNYIVADRIPDENGEFVKYEDFSREAAIMCFDPPIDFGSGLPIITENAIEQNTRQDGYESVIDDYTVNMRTYKPGADNDKSTSDDKSSNDKSDEVNADELTNNDEIVDHKGFVSAITGAMAFGASVAAGIIEKVKEAENADKDNDKTEETVEEYQG